MLCKNRPEGFGTHSSLSSLPTTCFTDTVLLPLPTYLLVLALPTLIITTRILRSKRQYTPSTKQLQIIASPNASPPQSKRSWRTCFLARSSTSSLAEHKSLPHKIAIGFYYLFVVANVLLAILEIARLATISFGIALLPIVVVGIVVSGALHTFSSFNALLPHWQGVNVVFWLLSMVFSLVKTMGLVGEGVHGREGSMYPVADQVTDTGVMAGVYLLLAGLEAGLWVVDVKKRRVERERSAREGSMGSERAVLEEEMERGGWRR